MKFRSENFEISSKDLQHNDKDIDQTMLKICSIRREAGPQTFSLPFLLFFSRRKEKEDVEDVEDAVSKHWETYCTLLEEKRDEEEQQGGLCIGTCT